MTSSNLEVCEHGSASFVGKVLIFIMFWVIFSIVGLNYYIFYLDAKKENFEQTVLTIETSLSELNNTVLDLTALLNTNLDAQTLRERSLEYSEKIIELQNNILEWLIEFDRYRDQKGKSVDFESIFLDVQKDNLGSYQRDIAQVQNYIFNVRNSNEVHHYFDLELLKRLLVGFAIFTVVFILLSLSSVRKKFQKRGVSSNGFDEEGDLSTDFYNKVFLYSCFQRMQEPCLILNKKREVRYVNQMFTGVWEEYSNMLNILFSKERNTSNELKKMIIPSIEKGDSKYEKLQFGTRIYSFSEEAIWDGSTIIGYELKLLLDSDILEYEVLSKNIALMSQDVWDVPVRVLREDSPVGSLANQLETIRCNVLVMFEDINLLSEASGLVQIKKLKHVLTLLQDIKKGAFDFNFDHSDVLKLSEKINKELESASEDDLFEIKDFVDDLSLRCDDILSSEESISENQQAISFLRTAEDDLKSFSGEVLQTSEDIYKKVKTNIEGLDHTLQSLNSAKEVTLNAMHEGQYEDDELDLKQFFIDDVGREMDSVISAVEKNLVSGRAILKVYESNLQSSHDKIESAIQRFQDVPIKRTDSDELVDRVRLLIQGLSAFDAKIQDTLFESKQKAIDVEDEGEDENGDW